MFVGIGIMEFMWCELNIWGKDIKYMIRIELLNDYIIRFHNSFEITSLLIINNYNIIK